MYHSRFKGRHYEAGFQWGTRLYQHGLLIMDNHLIDLSPQRHAFSRQCLAVYEKWYPAVLAEIRGIADGQHADFEALCTFLLSMYCFTFTNKCTCLAISTPDQILFGRNSDFLVELEHWYLNCLYHLDGVYAFNGNTTAFVQMEDGVNECGLAVGLTFVYPHQRQPGLNAGMLVRYILEHCGSTAEALVFLKEVPIASAQTITLADRRGHLAVAECCPGQQAVIRPLSGQPFVVTANNFNHPDLAAYRNPPIDEWHSDLRYTNACQALKQHPKQLDTQLIQAILSGRHGFMCQYDRRQGADTVWSVIYDLKHLKILRTEGNPCRKAYQPDNRMNFVDQY